MGWFLSQTGDYDYLILRNHKYTGISVAVVSFIFYGLKSLFVQRIFQLSDKTFSGIIGSNVPIELFRASRRKPYTWS
jgi:hypothetical protein